MGNTPEAKLLMLFTFLERFCNWDDTHGPFQLDLINTDILEQRNGMSKEMQIRETKSNPFKGGSWFVQYKPCVLLLSGENNLKIIE